MAWIKWEFVSIVFDEKTGKRKMNEQQLMRNAQFKEQTKAIGNYIHITLKELRKQRIHELKWKERNKETLNALKQVGSLVTVKEVSKILKLSQRTTLTRLKELEKIGKVRLEMQSTEKPSRFYLVYKK